MARLSMLLGVLALCGTMVHAQQAGVTNGSQTGTKVTVGDASAQATAKPITLDRVAAIVNKSVILESDLDEEMRFAAFEPFSVPKDEDTRQAAMQRLIDRDLMSQQMKSQPAVAKVTDEQVNKELDQLRRSLPACAGADCTSEAGWTKFCESHGFTTQEIFRRWKLRMTLLAFIEQRFRTGIRISDVELEDYYNKEFVPAFDKKGIKAPPLNDVNARIHEILLQRRVNALLDQWLESLRDQGEVQILNPLDMPPPNALENVPPPTPPVVSAKPNGAAK